MTRINTFMSTCIGAALLASAVVVEARPKFEYLEMLREERFARQQEAARQGEYAEEAKEETRRAADQGS